MKQKTAQFCLLFALTAVPCAQPSPAAGEPGDAAAAKAKLAEVRGLIEALTKRLGDDLKQRDALGARLREADLGVKAMRLKLDALRAAQLAARKRRAELRADAERVEHELDEARAALAAQANAAYMMGRQEPLRLLLNQSDPQSVGRMAVYYGYFAREQSARIASIEASLRRIGELTAQIDAAAANLHALEDDTARGMADLERARAARASALAAVARQVQSGNHELADLNREERAEEALVAGLARVLEDFPVDSRQSFESLRGHLAWPVPGRFSAHTTAARGRSDPPATGVLIETTRGAKVRAPFFGRVIYADWLQGLGLLLIIGHTGNYMTLYGHAEVLYKSVGDSVAPGDVIAALSDAGSATPTLYFEIRQGRKSLDPRLWLKAGP